MKKGKKRLLLGWICLLLSLCMVTVASAETDGTPIQPCHQVTMTERKSTAQNGASISVWHITTALGTVDAELNALADDYAAELSPLLQKPGRERTQNSALTVRILHSRTGMSWMSFMVQARLEYHRQVQQVRFTTRTYDMLTGQRITLADIFPADSPAWTLISQTVRDTANAYYPDETPDAAAVEALCENLAQADFMLYGMSLVIPLPSVYENHPQLMQATLYYPQIRAYMTEEAQRQTDNASLYRFCALTYDDGPNQWITPHVLDALMKTGARDVLPCRQPRQRLRLSGAAGARRGARDCDALLRAPVRESGAGRQVPRHVRQGEPRAYRRHRHCPGVCPRARWTVAAHGQLRRRMAADSVDGGGAGLERRRSGPRCLPNRQHHSRQHQGWRHHPHARHENQLRQGDGDVHPEAGGARLHAADGGRAVRQGRRDAGSESGVLALP